MFLICSSFFFINIFIFVSISLYFTDLHIQSVQSIQRFAIELKSLSFGFFILQFSKSGFLLFSLRMECISDLTLRMYRHHSAIAFNTAQVQFVTLQIIIIIIRLFVGLCFVSSIKHINQECSDRIGNIGVEKECVFFVCEFNYCVLNDLRLKNDCVGW